MKKIFVFLIAINLVFYNFLLAYSTNPKDFVEELVNDAIEKLANKDLTKEDKSIFIEKIALENVDINALSLYTLGELRKTSNDEDLKNYKKTFEKYFLKSLTSRFGFFSLASETIQGAKYLPVLTTPSSTLPISPLLMRSIF